MVNPYKPTHPIYGPAFARDMKQRAKQTPPASPFRAFDVHCLRCGSYELRMHAEFDEAEGEMRVWLICAKCRQQEMVRQTPG